MPGVIQRLVEIVGPGHALSDPDLRQGFETDWTGRFVGRTPLVVRPATTEEVAEVIRVCAETGTAVVPQGGNTGLVGGGVPLAGEVVLSTRRLVDVGEVDALAAQVTVGAGVTLATVQARAAASGLAVGIDLAARDSATIGGMVATNAGGLTHVRHGGMRTQVAGVEAVLGDGSLVSHLGGLLKDNTGYDLASLLCGSEGTLGVVTAVRLRLVPPVRSRITALVSVAGVDEALMVLADLRRAGVALEAAELFFEDGMELVCAHLDLGRPLGPAPAYLLMEWDGDVAALEAVTTLGDAVVATDTARRAALWRYREAHTEVVNALGIPHKLDVALPASALSDFAAAVRAEVARVAPGSTVVLFGHLADGNLHVNVVGPPLDEDTVDDAVLRLVAASGGSISAEHGIGTAKKQWLHLVRSEEELAAFRRVKAALDPAGILNPNALLP